MNVALLRIVPRARSAKDLLALSALEQLALVEALGQQIDVRAGAALEPVLSHGGVVWVQSVCRYLADVEEVTARRADCIERVSVCV